LFRKSALLGATRQVSENLCIICLNVAEGDRVLQVASATTSHLSIPPSTSPSLSWSTSFRSASELATALLRLGKSFDVLQLSAGPLQGHFSVVHLKDLSIFSIQTNQLLLLNGERGTDSITFSL
jgi:AraC family ethanolamine operon transcriptional activator